MTIDDLISRRPQGRSGLAEWYSAVFDAQREEGLTTEGVATLLEVTPSNISYWKRRLRSCDSHRPKAEIKPAKFGLVEVRVAQRGHGSPPHDSLELRLGSAHSILVPSGFDPDDLRALVSALKTC